MITVVEDATPYGYTKTDDNVWYWKKRNGQIEFRNDEVPREVREHTERKMGVVPESFTVDGQFTSEGLSVSVYDESGQVVEETWFTYDEIEERKGDEESDFTFEIGGGR